VTLKWWRDTLEADWTPSRPSVRADEVPAPSTLTVEHETTRHRGRSGDLVAVMDGGPQNREAAGMGFTHRNVTTRLTFEAVTTESRRRMFGASGDKYGGVIGEVLYIIESYRHGRPGTSVVDAGQVNDRSGNTGKGKWLGTIEVEEFAYGVEI
jgi:hypothetical protein